ncbi:peptidase domain-containing ABC transporter [Chitinophaga sp. RAB17]|uniref:peptidase domain-containing ABC transporter n=1 Tax=Chitinophaga sp. RAB17 TaxID=3233049 RepID=UPI003F906CEC
MSRFPHERQRHSMDCGATCLRIIARYYGRRLPLKQLRESSDTSRDGASLKGLTRAAEENGFRTMAARINFEKLKDEAPLPLILHWQQHHFVVVYKVTSKKVYISDPAKGLITYSTTEFVKYWLGGDTRQEAAQGIVMVLEPTPVFYNTASAEEESGKIGVRPFLLHYLRPYHKLMLQVLASLLLGTLLQLVVPFLTQNIVDTGVYKKDLNFIWLVLIAQLMLTLGQLFLELMRSWMLLFMSGRINISLVSDFFSKLMRLPIRYFDSRIKGDLLQRINDHERIQNFLTRSSMSAVFSIFTLLAYSLVLSYYNAWLLLIFLASSVLYVTWILFFLKQRSRLDYKRFHYASENNSKIYELVSGMQEIKLYNAELPKRWSWERIQIKLYHVSISALRLEQAQSIGARIINETKNILISFYAAKLVIDGQVTLGTMLAVSYIIGQLNSPVLQLVSIIKEWQDARISLDRLMETYTEEDEVPMEAAGMPLPLAVPEDHTIDLRNVSFSYNGMMAPVLRDITLTIPAGKVTAIVGASGSGKTTLLKLLMRFYDPQKGSIRVGQEMLHKTDLHEWRKLCGVVMQEGFIFNDTITGNIAVGDDLPDYTRLKKACDTANISYFIDALPLKYDTKIGQEGMGISTGQKQRILIARAVYKNPEILFFDEATSALDANNEREIMEKLDAFCRNKTVVVIAHRLSTVMNADNIIVLDNGCLVEQGGHYELSLSKGYYYHLVKNQLELGG